jgi:hypothetical protein
MRRIVPTKTPTTKSKKPAAKAGAPAKAPAAKEPKAAGKPDAKDDPKKKRGPKAIAKPGAAHEDGDGDGDGDEEEDDEDEFIPKKGAAKPAAEPTAVVPARRLTPEAKAAINAMVQKGVPLDEALRRAGSWETFIAPVKDDTQKAFPGKDGAGPRSPFGGRRPSGPRGDKADKNDAPNGGFNFEDEDPGPSLGDDEPIVAGGDDD